MAGGKGIKSLIPNGRTPYLQSVQSQEEDKKLEMKTQESKKTQTHEKKEKNRDIPEK